MTEKMVKMYSTVYDLPTPSENRKREKKTVGIQTGLDNELFFFLTKKKSIRVYYSSVYKDIVCSFNVSNSKSFIFDRESWKILKNNFQAINNRFGSDE